MSTAKEIMKSYHTKVGFPISPQKIEAAGYDPEQYLKSLIRDLEGADDSHDPKVQDALRKMHLMERSYKLSKD